MLFSKTKSLAVSILICIGTSGCFIAKQTKKETNTDSANQAFGKPFNQFELQIPKDYNHYTQIRYFITEYRSSVLISSHYYIDSFYINASDSLIPGQKYIVSFYPILRSVSSQECIDFLKEQKAVFVNAQGISLAWELGKAKFPTDKWILSWDEQNSLLRATDVPYNDVKLVAIMGLMNNKIKSSNEGIWQLSYYHIDIKWEPFFAYLICFKLKPETTLDVE